MNTGSYVNGKWYHPSSKQISRNINPADTADVIAEFPLAGADDVRLAVDCVGHERVHRRPRLETPVVAVEDFNARPATGVLEPRPGRPLLQVRLTQEGCP